MKWLLKEEIKIAVSVAFALVAINIAAVGGMLFVDQLQLVIAWLFLSGLIYGGWHLSAWVLRKSRPVEEPAK